MSEFVWAVRVYYEDTDSAGVVYYANYLKFMERARTEWLRSLGIEQNALLCKQGLLFVVRSVNVDYRYPARFDDLLSVHTRIEARRRASLDFYQDILHQNSLQRLCSGYVKVACIDAHTFKPRPIPEIITETVSDA